VRSVLPLVVSCVGLCAAVMTYKVVGLGIPLVPEAPVDAFVVDLEFSADVTQPGARAHLAIPSASTSGLVDERFAHPGATRAIRVRPGRRTLSLTADESTTRLAVSYRFGLRGAHASVPDDAASPADLAASPTVPADDPQVSGIAGDFVGSAAGDTARVRAQYDFVLDEVTSGSGGDARQVLASRAGDAEGRVLLFVALVRSLGVSCRVVWSLPLEEGSLPRLHPWAEVFLEGRWVPVDPVRGLFGEPPPGELDLARGDLPPVRVEGLGAPAVRWSVARMSAREAERAASPAAVRGLEEFVTLDALPASRRAGLRVLLLVPLGALVVSLFRNVVGLPTFGTFMPVLVALALRDSPPLTGLLLLGLLVGAGLVTRWGLDRLRLLIVPRLSLLLAALVIVATLVTVVGEHVGSGPSVSIGLLPMVVLTMTVERLSLMVVEEGLPNAFKALGGTIVVSVACVALFASERLQAAVFQFPELLLLVVAALVVVGRYTGYRASEWLRFRRLAAARDRG